MPKPGPGRPKGAPNKATAEVKEIARKWGPAAIEEAAKLAGITHDGQFKAISEQARLAALSIILDRAYGKAAQPHTGEGGEGDVQVTVTVDRPPDETREQWIARRSKEIGVGGVVMGAAARPTNGRDNG